MQPQVIFAITAVILFILCLPIPATRKFILELFAWTLRFSLMALLIAGGVLWFRPELLPAECANFVNSSPELSQYLPAPFTPLFGLAATCFIAAVSLPCLAMLDVARRLAGRRTQRLCDLADGRVAVASAVAVEERVTTVPVSERQQPRAVTVKREVSRHIAADQRS